MRRRLAKALARRVISAAMSLGVMGSRGGMSSALSGVGAGGGRSLSADDVQSCMGLGIGASLLAAEAVWVDGSSSGQRTGLVALLTKRISPEDRGDRGAGPVGASSRRRRS